MTSFSASEDVLQFSSLQKTVPLSATGGEDSHSINNHESVLLMETKKSRPRIDLMKMTMERSLVRRSNKMPTMTTKQAIEEYPYLGIPELLLMLHQMQILYNIDLDKKLLKNLDQLYPAILKKATKLNSSSADMASILNLLPIENDQISTGLKKNAALSILPYLLGEKGNSMYLKDKETRHPYPVLKIEGGENILHSDDIFVEADCCCLTLDDGTTDVTFGISLLMSVYWIYGFEYPKQLNKTFSFLEKYLFEIKSTNKNVPISVIGLYSDLQKKN